LPAVAGKFGVRGGGYIDEQLAPWNIERTWLADQEPPTRAVNMNKVGRILTEPEGLPVNVLFVYNCNPVAILPDQRRVIRGLEREDLFTVVFDQVLTDTAMYADVVLPATTFLEHYDFARGYGPITLQLGKPVIDVVGESRSNTDVFMDLARRLDLSVDGDPADELEAMLGVLGELPQKVGDDLRDRWKAEPPHGGRPIQFVDVFPKTTDRKVNLFPRTSTPQAADRPLRVSARPGHDRVSARADFAGERAHDQLDARRAVTARGAVGNESRGCWHARDQAGRRDPGLERARRDADQCEYLPADQARNRRSTEGRVAPQHEERLHIERHGAGLAVGSGRRRVL
jgi:anaerobic selenocysteine-containing dehydrogenase